MLRREFLEVVRVENLLPRTRAVPEAHLAGGAIGLEQVREVSPQRRHAGSAANVDHLALGRFDVKIAEGPDRGDDVARLEVKHVARADTRRTVLPGRRSGDADVE